MPLLVLVKALPHSRLFYLYRSFAVKPTQDCSPVRTDQYVGSNIYEMSTKENLEKMTIFYMNDPEIIAEINKILSEYKSDQQICYATWNDQHTYCKKNVDVKNNLSSLKNFGKKSKYFTTYGIFFDCNTGHIYSVWVL